MANSQTVFVTGATGFLGRHLLAALCRAGYNVRALVRQPEAHQWLARYPNLTVIQGDILDASRVNAAMQGSDLVIHGAGKFRFWGNASTFQRTNIDGADNVFTAASTMNIRAVIHISTIAVIGNPDPSRVVDETHPPHPADPYQASKLAAEQHALSYHVQRGLPVIVLRPGAFYGPLGTYGFNRLFFRDPMRGIIMQLDGGRYIIFPAYVPDVARGILQAIQHGRPGEIYNICDDPITHKEAFDVVCEEANLRFPRMRFPGWVGISTSRIMEAFATITRREPFYPLNLRSYVYNYWRVSNQKARTQLGFEPTSFRVGVRQTVAWYRAGQPEWIADVDC